MGGQRTHIKAVVNKAQHDGEEEEAETVLSPGRKCFEMLKMAFWGIFFPSLLSMKNEGFCGRPVPRVNASSLLLPCLPLSS